MSHIENSNGRQHVNNNVESNLSGSIQSKKDGQNLVAATNALHITNETRSCTQINVTKSNVQTNSTIPSMQSDGNVHNLPIFDLSGPSSQRNDIGSKAYMRHYERKPLAGLTPELWEHYRTKYPTPKYFKKAHPKIEYTQLHTKWYRIVSISHDSKESCSSSKPRRNVQHKKHGHLNTAGVTDSQLDAEWYRKVNRDVIESQKSVRSSKFKKRERKNQNQHSTSSPSSIRAHLNHHRLSSPVNNIQQASSQTVPISLNAKSCVNAEHQSDNIIRTTNLPTLHYQLQNLNSDQSSTVSISTSSVHNATQDTALVPSSIATINSNRAQVLIDLDDFGIGTEDLSLSVPLNSSNSGNHLTRIIPTPHLTNASIINEPETVEIIIRSRNYGNYSIIISNPTIIQMHRILQRSSLSSDNTYSPANNTVLFEQVNNYMQFIRRTIETIDTDISSILSLMSLSIPRLLTIDQSSYHLLHNASEKPPVITNNRIQNGCVIKELTNCAICLEENNGNVLLEPCKHYNMCRACMERLTTWICPICRSHITSIIVYV
ncbi:uncharacterized protein LOC112603269 [Melanaphis sacchari]|uniref:uncharacterized protein LOC112603269 n=1 Tax=Melanaphis sacchari TaxID=742174 RepID=UPI000DC14AEB|nr:uncharacterized protein LOC112603269 [Melanaphis sacchari]